MDRTIKISFCIPSLNRPAYLLAAINSICSQNVFNENIQLCIFNNNSEQSYIEVENSISTLSKQHNIKYKKNDIRLNIDQSMCQAISMAEGEYLFLLGDDDFLLPEGLSEIVTLVNTKNFDLAVCNAVVYNEVNDSRTDMFKLRDIEFTDLKDSLLFLKNYCSYGNIIVKSKFFNTNDFRHLEGTSHAYGCFWLEFFRLYEDGAQPKVIVPKKSIVCLRAVEKTYNLLQVTFEHSQKEFDLYYEVIGQKSRQLLHQYELLFWKDQSRFKKLLLYGLTGNNLSLVKNYNAEFGVKYALKIEIARLGSLCLSPFKGILKRINAFFKTNKVSEA